MARSPKMTSTNPSMFDLSGNVVLLTGAAGHLGRAMTLALCECGAIVYANGRDKGRLQRLVRDMDAKGHDARVLNFDVTDDSAIEAALTQIGDEAGRLDVVVNNAYAGSGLQADDVTRRAYAQAYDLAVASSAAIVTFATPLLREAASDRGSSSVINVATMYGTVSPDPRIYRELPPNPPHYGPAKAALVQWTRYMACRLGPDQIRVNAVSPGPFPNPGVAAEYPDFVDRLADRTPLHRIGQPAEIGGAVVFLASRASSYVTGANIAVDGGWTAW
ncbi:SDR family NAD(P)-dependent oxidoreductase [Oceaniradius stylonematis]|uniref:SDR family NAD(P)-dependent oxidoreductase n=1 Tax=Oceaniradius stylonematis TaxID=2184161 RepID=UPI003C7C3687